MSAPVRLAVVGAGRWGRNLIRNLLALPEAQLLAVVDASAAALAALQQQLALPGTVQCLTDWRQALELPALQAVVVATPAATHKTIIQASLEHRLHVLSEKPLTLDADSCGALCQLAQRQQRQLVVDHTYLFHPAVRRGRDAIATHQLGQLRYGYASRTNLGPVRQDVDALWDLAVHDIAILNYWLAQKPVRVKASGTVWLQPQSRPGFPRGLPDVGWITLAYADGFEATLHVSWLNPDKQRRIAVLGNQGTLVFDEMAHRKLMLYGGHLEQVGPEFVPAGMQAQPLNFADDEPLRQVCYHFLDCIRSNQASEISPGWLGQDLARVQSAIAQALLSEDWVELS